MPARAAVEHRVAKAIRLGLHLARQLRHERQTVVDAWNAFFFPKDTPDAIVQKLYEATNQTLKLPVTVERLKRAGVAPIASGLRTPAYLQSFIGKEVENWAAQIKASGVPIE
jgi:tripartite-type tricarboxylate transporter receptor subunit TctC